MNVHKDAKLISTGRVLLVERLLAEERTKDVAWEMRAAGGRPSSGRSATGRRRKRAWRTKASGLTGLLMRDGDAGTDLGYLIHIAKLCICARSESRIPSYGNSSRWVVIRYTYASD